MNQTFLLAGASNSMAVETARILQSRGDKVIGISRQPGTFEFDSFFQVKGYEPSDFPVIEEPLDGLVYFPGSINLKPFARLTREEFNTDFSINALGAVSFLQFYLNNLKKSSSASIVLISTVAVAVGLPFHSSVSMAKGAIEGLTKALAAELAPAIRVNAVAPSLVDTPLGEKFINSPEKLEQMQKRNPLRKVGEAADVAHTIAFLLGEEARWITGQIFAVDGGMSTIKNG